LGRQPADLIGPDAADAIAGCDSVVRADQLRELLARGFLLSQAVDRWHARGMWVISRADEAYPKRWKTRLKEDCPPVLYGCGDVSLLAKGGLAVVGSRDVDDDVIRYTETIGRLAAEAGMPVVSGGARGIDETAMRGALDHDGSACGILADSLEKQALARSNRSPLMEQRLVLVSPYDPAARFNVGHAMGRNKLIYALADTALVVNSALESGGTWAGAVEQLSKYRWTPLYVRATGDAPPGNHELLARGGLLWPEPALPSDLLTLRKDATTKMADPAEPTPLFPNKPDPVVPAERLFSEVRALAVELLKSQRTESEFADALAVPKTLAKTWLSRLVEEGLLVKSKKPVRYHVATQGSFLAEEEPKVPRRTA
jgi:predicted Rossmann fold nucleotide-binding protein DprA/Smf involved in DNA uptake